jgi:assimilatory nitrate reductase catalytic subunit
MSLIPHNMSHCGVLRALGGWDHQRRSRSSGKPMVCSKGAALGETIDLEGRLLHPKVNDAYTDWGHGP